MSAATVSLSNTDLLTTKDSYRASVWIYTISKRLRSKSRQETRNDENKKRRKQETTKTRNDEHKKRRKQETTKTRNDENKKRRTQETMHQEPEIEFPII